jgi:predicted ATPase/class 3 adenylate cyclase
MDFRILGPLEVLDEDRAVTLSGSKQRALLALFLVHANETLTTDRLIDELWGAHPPARAAKTVQMHVSRLRRALGADGGMIVTREGGYELRLRPEQLDSLQFEWLSAQGSGDLGAGRPEAALERLAAALSLWHDSPLADLAYEPFAQRETERLLELRAATLEHLIEAKLLLGRQSEVIVDLERLVAEHPYRERLRAQLMLALYRSERQAEALQAYQDARRRLVEDLGIEPGERLRELERQILAQDPSLSAPETRVEADGAKPAQLPTGEVTFMLTDIEGSTVLWEAQREGMAVALRLHDELIARTVHENGGRLLKSKGEGDSTMSVFSRASDAVSTAVALQEALGAMEWPDGLEPRVRIALHTGETEEHGGDYFGPVLNRAARMRSLREGGVTVVSQATAEVVRDLLPDEVELIDLGRHALRGLARPENVFELRPVAQSPLRPPYETRKTVSVLFASVVATARRRELDLELRERLVLRCFREMRGVLERHGGTIGAYPGDAMMAVFGVPRLHEDDAVRAVRAAGEMANATLLGDDPTGTRDVQVSVQVGIGTGEVIAPRLAAGRELATGDAVNLAKCLEEVARPNEILIDEETYRLVRSWVHSERSDRDSSRSRVRLAAFRVVDVLAHPSGRAPRLDSPLVGRDRQLATLSSVFSAAVGDRACHLVTVLGPAGVGKSRLAGEFTAGLGDQARVLWGRCLPYGEGITYWPLAEVVSDLTSAESGMEPSESAIAAQLGGEPNRDPIVAGVAEALGLGDSHGGTSEEIFRAVRGLFEALARTHPLVLVFDDLQWAEPTFLDLVDHLTDFARDAPLVVLCIARTELLEGRSGWGGGKRNVTSVHLEPLDDSHIGKLIANLLRRGTLPAETAARIAARAAGNPLFAEEVIANLIEDGLLRREGEHWTLVDTPGGQRVPSTIQALLDARLAQLPDDERALLEYASVEGTVFHRKALDEVTQTSRAAALERHLTSLVRRDVICPDRPRFPEDEAFRFRHVLIRDAAYRSLPLDRRAELHARFAAWLEQTAGSRLSEFEEIVGYHLERSYHWREELDEVDADAQALAVHGADRLESAGRRALARGDHTGAVRLLERAAALLRDDPLRAARLLPDLGAALIEAGRLPDAKRILANATREAAAAGDESATAHVLVHEQFRRLQHAKTGSIVAAAAVADQVIPIFERDENQHGLCDALNLRARAYFLEAQADAASRAWEQAAQHARRAGAESERIEILSWLASSLWWGPTPVAEGIIRCEQIRSELGDNPAAEAQLLEPLAALHAMEGRFDRARELQAISAATFEELGLTLSLAVSHTEAGTVELLAGDPAAAEQSLRRGYQALEQIGERNLLSTTVALLAQALLAQRRDAEAERLAEESQKLADEDDLITQILWRGARARALAARGRVEEAERLAQQAVALSEKSDFINDRADALVDLAIVHRQAGQLADARSALTAGLELYEKKGNKVATTQAKSDLASLGGA